MATIYEDVEALKEQMEQVQTDIQNLQNDVTILTEDADLNNLSEGKYLIPTATISASILNKPTTSSATAFVVVVPGGSSGQMSMYYMPCNKATATYYYRAYYQSTWGSWNTVNCCDSGWLDLPLADSITAYSDEQKPRYRRIGKEVFISGVLRGVTTNDQVIATLPADYRPSKKVMFSVCCVGQMVGKLTVNTNGTIVLNRTTIEPVVAENWHSIACSFCVD